MSRVVSAVNHQLLVACPFIRAEEAHWLVSKLGSKRSHLSRVDVLTDVRSECVLNGSLELEALSVLSSDIRATNIVNLPRLHAKVYIADTSLALITSANLTPSGLDFNFEYGIAVSDSEVVRQIALDIRRYMQLGNVLMPETIEQLKGVAADVAKAIEPAQRIHEKAVSARFRLILKKAQTAFLQAQVGQRSAHALFADAVLYILGYGPLSTRDLHPRIQQLFPDLCNDAEILVINGQEFGKKWKHTVRNVQQALKKAKKIEFDGRVWMLAKQHEWMA